MEKTLIAYYTGTGSSGLVAREVRDQLIARGVSVEMHRLTEATKEDLRRKAGGCIDLILIYAVHAFNAPNPVLRVKLLDRMITRLAMNVDAVEVIAQHPVSGW